MQAKVLASVLLLNGRRQTTHKHDLVGHVEKGSIVVASVSIMVLARIRFLDATSTNGGLPSASGTVGEW